MSRVRPVAVLSLGGALLLGLAVATAAAQPRRRDVPPPGYVVAESWWGHGSISAPVRRGPVGWQVQLPGGNWIDCARSCRHTLRQQTVDFWESNGTQAKDGGPGYFRWDFNF